MTGVFVKFYYLFTCQVRSATHPSKSGTVATASVSETRNCFSDMRSSLVTFSYTIWKLYKILQMVDFRGLCKFTILCTHFLLQDNEALQLEPNGCRMLRVAKQGCENALVNGAPDTNVTRMGSERMFRKVMKSGSCWHLEIQNNPETT